jgi:hypothetical protein
MSERKNRGKVLSLKRKQRELVETTRARFAAAIQRGESGEQLNWIDKKYSLETLTPEEQEFLYQHEHLAYDFDQLIKKGQSELLNGKETSSLFKQFRKLIKRRISFSKKKIKESIRRLVKKQLELNNDYIAIYISPVKHSATEFNLTKDIVFEYANKMNESALKILMSGLKEKIIPYDGKIASVFELYLDKIGKSGEVSRSETSMLYFIIKNSMEKNSLAIPQLNIICSWFEENGIFRNNQQLFSDLFSDLMTLHNLGVISREDLEKLPFGNMPIYQESSDFYKDLDAIISLAEDQSTSISEIVGVPLRKLGETIERLRNQILHYDLEDLKVIDKMEDILNFSSYHIEKIRKLDVFDHYEPIPTRSFHYSGDLKLDINDLIKRLRELNTLFDKLSEDSDKLLDLFIKFIYVDEYRTYMNLKNAKKEFDYDKIKNVMEKRRLKYFKIMYVFLFSDNEFHAEQDYMFSKVSLLFLENWVEHTKKMKENNRAYQYSKTIRKITEHTLPLLLESMYTNVSSERVPRKEVKKFKAAISVVQSHIDVFEKETEQMRRVLKRMKKSLNELKGEVSKKPKIDYFIA